MDWFFTKSHKINKWYCCFKRKKRNSKIKNSLPIFSHPLLEVGTKVRVALDAPEGYVERNKLSGTFRATDIRWTKKIFKIVNVIINNDQPVLYMVSDHPTTAYTFERLQPIYKDEQLPPESVLLKEISHKKAKSNQHKDVS